MTPLGLTLNFLSFFTGLVDFMHLDPKKAGKYFSNQAVRNVAPVFSFLDSSVSQSSKTASYRAGPRAACGQVSERR